mgnify:CR=1 FL=1
MKFLFKGIFLLSLCIFLVNASVIKNKTIILATTTSVVDTGILEELIPLFERKTGYFVKIIAVGSGQALLLGKKGEADILLVHSPDEEKQFMKDGYGINRRFVMYNDFVLLGPPHDPANTKHAKNILDAFKKIFQKKALFISRGDHSGTHMKELFIWKSLNIDPTGKKWYQETGSGMGLTLSIASEKLGYVLSDKGTFLSLKRNLNLQIVHKGDKILKNIYHVIIINPNMFKNINYDGAKALADFFVSHETQSLIKQFGIKKFGEPLFKTNITLKEN